MSALQKNNPNKRSDHGDGYSRNPYETEEDDRRDLPAIFKKERHPIDSSDSMYGISLRGANDSDPRDYDSDDDELPIVEEIDEYDAPSRGRRSGSPPPGERGGRPGSPKRSGSPEPPRDEDDDLGQLVVAEPLELEPEWNAELEGFEKHSDATGFYSGDKQEPKFPKELDVVLWDLAETAEQKQSGKGLFKACTCEMDQFGDVFAAMVAPDSYEEEVKANPPIGSWHLFVSKFIFIDGEEEAEFRFDVIPGDGLSRAGTTSTFTERSLEVRCDLLEHRAGERSWTFAFKTSAEIVPAESRVKIYPTKKKVKIVVKKKVRGYWPTPGNIYAPITKANYRDGLRLTDCNRS